MSAYPKTVITFNLFLVSNESNSDVNLFSACLNACIVLLNQAGIHQKSSPYAALTISIDPSFNISTDPSPLKDTEQTLVDLVADPDLGILHMETISSASSSVNNKVINPVDVLLREDTSSKVQARVTSLLKSLF